LSEGGLFAQWLPLYQMSLETLRIITRTFVDVFPHTTAYFAHFNVESPVLGLVGSRQAFAHTSHWYRDSGRFDAFWESALEPLALAREIDLFGCVLGDDGWLRRWVDGAPLNTDEHPILVFTAPRFLYDRSLTRHGVLQHLLSAWAPSQDTLSGALPRDDPRFTERVVSYASARNLYLRGELARYGAEHPREPLELLLHSVQASPEFRTAYVKAMQIAVDVRGSDPATSLEILQKLTEVAPGEPSASEALRQLFP
jgi:spermidine synthase